jgi:hypothetical protein
MTDPVATLTFKIGTRWFPRRGHRTWYDRGFRSKRDALAWIDDQHTKGTVDWQSGFMVKFYGQSEPVEIVDRLGRMPKL